MLASDNPLEVIAEQAQEITDLKGELADAIGILRRIDRQEEFTPIEATVVQLFLRQHPEDA